MRTDIEFVCENCGKQMIKWMGRCPVCSEWNTIVQRKSYGKDNRGIAPASISIGKIFSLTEINNEAEPRLSTGIQELDRVLGGGIVSKSVILLGGDPGIGKSTLVMQALSRMARRGETVLYVSGEESCEQIKLRADRINAVSPSFLILAENRLEAILDKLGDVEASVIVLDSVQSIVAQAVESHPGSISQVRYVAAKIVEYIKSSTSACLVIGHVTKEGGLAGPKVLEHTVDTVLYFEGDGSHPYRILRSAKNRFGSTSEIGVFEMGDGGLSEVTNPSELFLSERPEGVSGSTVTALMGGARPILAEIQALVSGPAPGQGRRTCLGADPQRLALITAVMEKKLGLSLLDHDIFLNAVGGIKATEPAVDLAVAAALISSFADRSVEPGTLFVGEIGLAGEVRRVTRWESRITESARLGFPRIICPANESEIPLPPGVVTVHISHISQLAAMILGH